MVKGLDIFRERFSAFEGSFILIGGAACDHWFTDQGPAFRATKDLDIVLLIEVIDRRFVAAFREFVEEGGYEIRERTEKRPVLYRFAKTRDERFPAMLELFSRSPDALELSDGQTIIPVKTVPDHHSRERVRQFVRQLLEPVAALLEWFRQDKEQLFAKLMGGEPVADFFAPITDENERLLAENAVRRLFQESTVGVATEDRLEELCGEWLAEVVSRPSF